MSRWRVLVAVAAILFAGAAQGCSSSRAVLLATPASASLAAPASVRVTHLGSGQAVTATLTSTDVDGVRWRTSKRLRADKHGRLLLDDRLLMSSMRPEGPNPKGAYFWGDAPQVFRLRVADKSITFRERLNRQPVVQSRVREEGLSGILYLPVVSAPHRTAVLLIGGSGGGQPSPLLALLLAGEGHPVLALAYFKEPGLPATLSDIPLEYFAKAITWLGRQRGVDPRHVSIDGVSRGGEAALLIAATYPRLVHGVIAGVPSNVAGCAYPGCASSAWDLHGRPVHYTHQLDNPEPSDDPQAVIPVERIAGPVLLNCGGRDEAWTSCAFAHAVMRRLQHSPYGHQLQECQACDHEIGYGVPGEARTPTPSDADQQAWAPFLEASLRLLT